MTAKVWIVSARVAFVLALASMTSCALWARMTGAPAGNEPIDGAGASTAPVVSRDASRAVAATAAVAPASDVAVPYGTAVGTADGVVVPPARADTDAGAPATRDPVGAAPGGIDGATTGVLVNRIVATLDGEPITMIELDAFRARFENNPANPDAGSPDQAALLDELLMEKIFKKQVEAQGLTASDAQVEDYLESIRSRNQLTEEQLRAAVETRGLDYDAYLEQVRLDIERANLVNKEIRSRVNVTPEEVERYYQAHLQDYVVASRVHVRLISLLVPPEASSIQREVLREQIDEIHAEAAGGANFGKLAREYSQGPGAEDGGDLGVMGRGEMQSAFDEAAFTVAAGEVSDVIETDTGYHILKVEEHLAESHVPLEDVQDEIREELYREAMEERYDRWMTKDLRERHHIEILL